MRVAIVGTGFGGLSAATAAEKYGLEIVQVGPPRFEYLPSLAKILSGRKRPEDLMVKPSFRWDVVPERALKVIEEGGKVKVITEGEVIEADYAVLAPGSEPWMPVQGVFPLYRVSHAREVKKELDRIGEGARIAIVGSGLVGLEAAGELAWTREAGLSDYEVFILEGAPELAPTLPCKKVRPLIAKLLKKHKIKYYLNTLVSKVEDGKVISKDGKEFDADLVIWAAGVQGPSLEVPCASKARRGFIEVDEYLRAKGCKRIYVAGDASSSKSLKMAEEAMRHGWYAILHMTRRKEDPYEPFLTAQNPICFISLGPKDGVSVIRRTAVPGRLAPLVKDILEKMMISMAKKAKMKPPIPV